MTVRTDLTVDWDSSPRIITVTAPSTELSMQDLVDTLRRIEEGFDAMDEPHLVNASGKQALGGGVLVGITCELQNAQLSFEARPGPAWIQCNVSGGNLVAINALGSPISSISPTSFTQVILANSSSATLQELSAIQYSSFGGGISVNVEDGVPGTGYPVGTIETPSNNLEDAVAIANTRGFNRLFIRRNMTLNGGSDISDFVIQGESHVNTEIVIADSADCENLTIQRCNVVSGILDGGTHIEDCLVGDITYVNGHVHDCGLYGTILLDGNKDAVFNNCITHDQDSPPVIDMGGSGQSLAVPGYSGLLTIRNLSDPTHEIGVGLDHGMVFLDATITAGTVIIAGVGLLQNNGTPTYLNTDGLLNKSIIATAVNEEIGSEIQHSSFNNGVTIDVLGGVAGRDYPLGTVQSPVDNLPDALYIAAVRGFNILYVRGDLTLPPGEDVSDYTIMGQGSTKTTITINSGPGSTIETTMINVTLTGVCGGRMNMHNVNLRDISGLCASGGDANVHDSILSGTVELNTIADRAFNFINCVGYEDLVFDVNNCSAQIHLAKYTGRILFQNVTVPTQHVDVDLNSGEILIDASCDAGEFDLRGVGKLIDESTGSVVDDEGVMNKDNISSALLDTPLTTHDLEGSVGKSLASAAYRGMIFIDQTNGAPGTTYPTGTFEHPVDNMDDAFALAEAYSASAFHFHSSMIIEAGVILDYFVVEGHTSEEYTLTLQPGCSTDHVRFKTIKITGALSNECEFDGTHLVNVTGLNGVLRNSILEGDIVAQDDIPISISNCRSASQTPVNLSVGTASVAGTGWYGMLNVKDKVGTSEFNMHVGYGLFMIDPTCVAGSIYVAGSGTLFNNTGGSEVISADFRSPSEVNSMTETTIAEVVWDKLAADHTAPGSFGEMVNTIHNTETGKWEIVNNQMIFYKPDNTTEIMRFDLFNAAGAPDSTNVFKRVKV